MARGNRVEAGQSLPATVPDNGSLRNNLFPGQDVTLDGNRSLAEGAIALQRDAWTKSQLVLAKNAAIESEAKATAAMAKAKSEEAKAESEMAKARTANAEASLAEAEVEAKAKVADAEARTADAEARVVEAQAATKIRVAGVEALEADLKILKLRKEIDVLTGECEVKEFCAFCLSARLCVSLSLSAFLTRALWGLRILFSFCFSRQACSRTAEMRSSVAGPCS